jgi:hypothetical protein
MKNNFFKIGCFLCLLTAFALESCYKKHQGNPREEPYIEPTYGYSSFELNGVVQPSFLPSANYWNFNNDSSKLLTISFTYKNGNFTNNKAIVFSNIKFKDTSYNIIQSNGINKTPYSYYIINVEYDALGPIFNLDTIQQCNLTLTRIDTATKEIWGLFNGQYKLPTSYATPTNSPRLIKITNGSFYTKILN